MLKPQNQWKKSENRKNEVDALRLEYSNIFKPNNVPVKHLKTQNRSKDDGQPISCKAHTVPYAIKEQIEVEFGKFVKQGVLKPVKRNSYKHLLLQFI